MIPMDQKRDGISNRDLNRARGGLGIALALAISLGLFVLLAFFIVPSFESMFKDLETPLPTSVRTAFAFAGAARSPLGLALTAALPIAGIVLLVLNRKDVKAAYALLLALLAATALLACYLLLTLLYCQWEVLPAVLEKHGTG